VVAASRLPAFWLPDRAHLPSNIARPWSSIWSPGFFPATISSACWAHHGSGHPLYGRSATEGVLFLTGDREPDVPIRADDCFPVEMLAARIQSARSQTIMLEKLIDAEKIAGLARWPIT